ncbi:MAG: TolC family protein [Bacteriovoracia bacterium]
MTSKTIFIFLLLFVGSLKAVTLEESYKAALRNMESIKRASAVVEQTKELKSQAIAAVLPNVSGVGSYTKIDPPNGAGASPFLLTRQYSAAIRLTQPLIRGGLVSAYQLAEENILLAKFQAETTAFNLYQLVINSYFNLALAGLDVKNLEELLKFSRERVREIRERTKIGRSRKGELVEAEAQLHIAESQVKQAMITLDQARKTFAFYTDLDPEKIVVPDSIPDLKGSVDEYVSRIKTRPDILAAEQQIQVADQQVKIAKGGHYPQVDLTSNYYLDRTGVLETSEWDVGVAVVIPLFQGGSVQSQVRQAVQEKRIAQLNSSETQRAAARDVKISYQNILQIKEQLKSLRSALSKAEEAYRLNKKDYQYGLVTNLDVLQSLNVFIETKRSYDGLIAIGNLNFRNLQALTGVLP